MFDRLCWHYFLLEKIFYLKSAWIRNTSLKNVPSSEEYQMGAAFRLKPNNLSTKPLLIFLATLRTPPVLDNSVFLVQNFLTEHYDDFTFITRRMILLHNLGVFEANDVWHKEALGFLGMLETLQYSPIPGTDYCYHFRNADALQALDAYDDYKRQIKEPVFLDDLTRQVSEKKIGPIEFGRRLLLLNKNALTYNTP